MREVAIKYSRPAHDEEILHLGQCRNDASNLADRTGPLEGTLCDQALERRLAPWPPIVRQAACAFHGEPNRFGTVKHCAAPGRRMITEDEAGQSHEYSDQVAH